MIIILHVGLAIIIGRYLLARAVFLIKNKRFLSVVGELYVPFSLFVFYGLAGGSVYFLDRHERYSYAGVFFDDWDIFYSFLLASIAITTISFLLRLWWGRIEKIDISCNEVKFEKVILILLISLLAFDAFARANMISSGEYFSWLRGALIAQGELVGGSPVSALQVKGELILAALLGYKITHSKTWRYVFVIFLMLVFLKGQRGPMFQCVIISGFTFLAFSANSPNMRKVIRQGVLTIAVFIFASSAIVDVRGQFRENMQEAMDAPVKAIGKIVFEYIPSALLGQNGVTKEVSGASLNERITLWSGSFASELNRMGDGYSYMPIEYFAEAIILPIPAVLYPGTKPVVEQGSRTARWFNLGGNSAAPYSAYDPGSTLFSDIYKYGGAVLILILSMVYSGLLVLLARFSITRYRKLGFLLVFSYVFIIDIRANNFAQILVSFRDVTLILVVVEAIYLSSRLRFTKWQ